MHGMHETLLFSIELLLVASIIAVMVHRVRIPYSTALVLGGWVLGTYGLLPDIKLGPEIVLWVFLPILLFEAAIHTNVSKLRQDAVPVFALAVPGVLLSMGVIGGVIHWGLGMPWLVALLFGAIMAPTDTVSILSIFKNLKVPERLKTIVEGESLFNDGAAIVAFHALAATAVAQSAPSPLYEFGRVFLVGVGGMLVGGAVGALASFVMRETKEPLIEILVTTVLTYGSYLLAERLGVSGVIAIVTAGLTVGRFGFEETSPTARISIGSFWEYAGFVVNSVLFLLIGLQLELSTLFQYLPGIGIAILAVILGRALAVLPTCTWLGKLPLRWQSVLLWGNIKGSISMALALSLPLAYPGRNQLLAMTFGVVLFSLVVQGLTLKPFIRILKLENPHDFEAEYEKNQAALLAAKAVQDELTKLFGQGMVPRAIHNQLRSRYQTYVAKANRELKTLVEQYPALEEKELKMLTQQMIRLERGVILGALRDRVIGEDAAKSLLEKLDARLAARIEQEEEPLRVRGTTPL